MRTDIDASVKAYCASVDVTQFYRFLKKGISTEVALARASELDEIKVISEILREVFSGRECEYDRIFGPIATNCQGNSLLPFPHIKNHHLKKPHLFL